VPWRRKARGRPRKPDAFSKRRATTSAGRRPEPDTGSAALRARKRAITGREDLPIDGTGVLYGHGLLDRAQFDTLSMVTEVLIRVTRAWGGRDGNVTGLWTSITGAMIGTGFAPPRVADDRGSLADKARRQLQRICQRLDGSRNLVVALAKERSPGSSFMSSTIV
jgi:hypothetical protein